MLENKLKALIGEYAFQLCAAQHQIEELTKELNDLKKEKNEE